MIRATLNEPIPLRILIPEGQSDFHVRVRLLDTGGTFFAQLTAGHLIEGVYQAMWTPPQEGYFAAIYDVFLDPAFTMPSEFERASEDIEVTSEKTNILRLLGLNNENTVLDRTQYGPDGKITSARLRMYNSKANADAALAASPNNWDVGLLFVWSLDASWDENSKPKSLLIGRL